MASGLGGTSLTMLAGRSTIPGTGAATPPQKQGGMSEGLERLSATISLPMVLVVGVIAYFALRQYGD